MLTAMQESFLALTHLILWVHVRLKNVPVLPCKFLGKSAPCLQKIELEGIPFPVLPGLLLSASDLVTLHLLRIPHTGYIQPKDMVAALATLTRLEDLYIGFQSPASCPDPIHLPPITQAVLLALTYFKFWGAREYLEDFMAWINAPQLHSIFVYYCNQLIDFEIPQLWQFTDHSEDINPPMRCFIDFEENFVSFSAGLTTCIPEPQLFKPFPHHVGIHILCEGIDWQVWHISGAQSDICCILQHGPF
jgi:hypothetical protein